MKKTLSPTRQRGALNDRHPRAAFRHGGRLAVAADFAQHEFENACRRAVDLQPVAGLDRMILYLYLSYAGLQEVVYYNAGMALYFRGERIFAVGELLLAAGAPVEKPWRKFPVEDARDFRDEAFDEFLRVFAGGNGIDRAPVRRGADFHVFGVSRPPFDLEARYAGGHQLVDETQRTEVARGQHRPAFDGKRGVGLVHGIACAVFVEIHGFDDEAAAARLPAFPAARRSAECVMAHQAAPGDGHALRAVHEALDFRAGLADYACDFVERAFPCEDYALCALFYEEAHRRGVARRHLRGYVEARAVLFAQPRHSPVGNDERIDKRLRRDDRALDLLHLAFEHYRVQRQIALDAAAADLRHARQVGFGEIHAAARAHVECAQAEIDRIRASLHGGAERCEVARGREYFRCLHRRCRELACERAAGRGQPFSCFVM